MRYILTGGLSFAIELATLLSLNASGLNRTISVAISFWVGFIIAILLQKFFAFKNYQRKPKIILRQLSTYTILVAFNYVFTIGLVSLFPEKYIIVSRVLAIVLVTLWNYFIYKNIIFKTRDGEVRPRKINTLEYVSALRKYVSKHKKILIFYIACSVVVILFFLQYVVTGNKTLMGDFDYYSQLYEAFRTSVLQYGQFPAWNPWLSGGIPLWQNPQFGLISIQSLLVLPFGSIIGMKIAYIVYALAGFWGMYILSHVTFKASSLRSALVAFIWIGCGFFAGHGITHFTFTSFFLLPIIIFFIIERTRIRFAWLGLGLTMAIIALSSIHYATIFTIVIIAAYLGLSVIRLQRTKKGGLIFGIKLSLKDLLFVIKSSIVFVLLAGWQFIATYGFVSNNERLTSGGELYLSPIGIIKAIFMPVDASIIQMPRITWGWGEYSMYIGFACLIIVIIILFQVIKMLINKRQIPITLPYWILIASIIGIAGALIALGDYSAYSPFHLLHQLPGFTQTRVPSRWMIYTVFAILLLIASWKGQKKTINVLLILSVIELFITFGPLRIPGEGWKALPQTTFSATYSQHDNNFKHTQAPDDPLSYYWYTTRMNVGQIHADDSIINTLSSTPLLKSSQCANNIDASCSFVRSNNGLVQFWSPNKVIIKRTGSGDIKLNMNIDNGWKVNGQYQYATIKKLDPGLTFTLPGNSELYTLEYSPKLSPSWVVWKLSKL